MKNLLSIAGAVILGSTGVSSLLLDNNYQQSNQDELFDQTHYWNPDKSGKAISVTVAPRDPASEARNWFTFNLGEAMPSFSSLTFLGFNGITINWGKSKNGPYDITLNSISFGTKNNIKINNNKDFDKYANIEIFNKSFHDVLARCDAKINVGYTWYYENGNYFFQILIYQYIYSIRSLSSATNIVDLGTGFLLN